MARPVWTGVLSFGLVSIPTALYTDMLHTVLRRRAGGESVAVLQVGEVPGLAPLSLTAHHAEHRELLIISPWLRENRTGQPCSFALAA